MDQQKDWTFLYGYAKTIFFFEKNYYLYHHDIIK